tara:strand:- start:580 stop:750 length:171 start_codon:yes stop_codon:yes gene_type:complete
MLSGSSLKYRNRYDYKEEKSSVFRLFEIHYENEKNESGETPVFVVKEDEPKKKVTK